MEGKGKELARKRHISDLIIPERRSGVASGGYRRAWIAP
jgi:hypothetical protein